MPDKAK